MKCGGRRGEGADPVWAHAGSFRRQDPSSLFRTLPKPSFAGTTPRGLSSLELLSRSSVRPLSARPEGAQLTVWSRPLSFLPLHPAQRPHRHDPALVARLETRQVAAFLAAGWA